MGQAWLGRIGARVLIAAVLVAVVPADLRAQGAKDVDALNRQAAQLHSQGKFAEAAQLAKRALTLAERNLAPGHPALVASLENLAEMYRMQGKFADAESVLKRLIAAKRAIAKGRDDEGLANSLHTLATILRAQGRLQDALDPARQAVEMLQRVRGENSSAAANGLNTLAIILQELGRSVEAEAPARQSLAIRLSEAKGQDTGAVAQAYQLLSVILGALTRMEEGGDKALLAAAIWERLGEAGASANALNTAAGMLKNTSRVGDAETAITKAIAQFAKDPDPDNEALVNARNTLVAVMLAEDRAADALPIARLVVESRQRVRGADNSETGNALNTLGDIQIRLGRPEEAEVTARQVVRIWDKSFGARSNAAANARNTLASTLMAQGKLADALQAAEEAFAIWKSLAPAPGHDDVFGAWRVATIHAAMGNRAAAEPLFQHAYDMWLAILGPTDARTNLALSGLALVHFANSDWARSYEESGKLIAAAAERSGFGTAALGSAISSSFASEIERSRRDIELNIKAAYRLAEAEPARRGELAALTFERAQWALNTKAAAALALMAARTAKGSQAIAKLVSEREALLKNWQEVNTKLYAALSASSSISGTVPKLRAQLGEIEKKKSAIDAALSENFPNYAEVSTVQPASISQLTNASSSQPRALLGGNDALILILPTDEIAPAGAETFIWAVTETKTRWVRSGIGTAELASMVQALRCGLDEDAWIGGGAAQCSQQLNMPVNKAPDVDAPLPFDLARAQALYTALFGELKDIIEGKDLFIVPSGPLSQLPFQVLVTSLSNETSSGWRQRDVGLLGAEMTDLAPNERQALKLPAGRGTKIVKPLPNSAAEAAGLKSGDILLSIGGADAGNIQEAGEAIRAYPAGARVRLWVLRAGAGLNITATLGRKSVSEWVPRLLAETEGRHVAWLIRDHALTVLPAVSSLDALRRVARPSAAAKPMIGFGNPLLEGMPDDPKFGKDDARRAKLARELEHCPVPQLVASNKMAVRGVQALSTAGGLASVKQIRIQVPLPETAYELCAVASDVHADPDAIYLGRNATEREVKRLNATGQLAHYRIVHFATHGAFAGPIGNEPGLILTPPKVASEEDDGYLTASEIAGLKLDADWVILSACNTAAGGAENAEALSGLARAFIYAQARALLVSHWAVKSGATVKLITGAISRLAADKTMGRAEAMRQSMLVLIKTGTEREAHPSYWAPFIVVGEGGAPR